MNILSTLVVKCLKPTEVEDLKDVHIDDDPNEFPY